MGAAQELETAGRQLMNFNLSSPVKTGAAIGLGAVVVGGIGLALFQLGGGFVAGTTTNIIRGVTRLGSETVSQGVPSIDIGGAE